MDDEAKFVRDSRDEARERRLERDTGRSMTDVETFVDALVSEEEESESTSSVTRALNEEFGTGRGAVRVRDGRGGATKATLTHPSGAYADVYLRGGKTRGVSRVGRRVLFKIRSFRHVKHLPTRRQHPRTHLSLIHI